MRSWGKKLVIVNVTELLTILPVNGILLTENVFAWCRARNLVHRHRAQDAPRRRRLLPLNEHYIGTARSEITAWPRCPAAACHREHGRGNSR
jgi:hypothetical protein